MKLLKAIPFSVIAVTLACASLGNLLVTYSLLFKYSFGGLALILWFVFLLKIIFTKDHVINDLKNPANGSIATTFTMSTMVLLTYVYPYIPDVATMLWYLAIVIQIVIMISFIYYFIIRSFKFDNVIPGWFVTFVGFGIIPVTAKTMNQVEIGQIFFYVALLAYLILLPIIIKRVFFHVKLNTAIIPSVAIFLAPPNLCLFGYINSFEQYNLYIVYILLFMSFITYILVFVNLRKLLENGFYPSYAALTFPFVISATAITNSSTLFPQNKSLSYIAIFETLVAVVLVMFVLYQFINHVNTKYLD